MKISQVSLNQVEVDVSMIPLAYQTVTLALPGKKIIVDLESGIIEGRPVDSQLKLDTRDLITEFETYQKGRGRLDSTVACYHPVLAALAEFVPEWPPNAEEVNEFFDRYRDKKYSPVTAAEYWVRLNACFKWAQTRGHIMLNPMKQVPRPEMPEVEAQVIAPRDFVKMINFLRDITNNSKPRQRTLPYERAIRDLAILRFTYATGCRIAEVAHLRLRDLHLDEQWAEIKAETSKSRERRSVYFGYQARRSLETWLDIRPVISDQVFLGTRGNGWSKKRFTATGIYQAWRTWQAAAGIGPYEFHEIRHSHVTHSLNNGVPIHHVSRQAGHRSPKTTLRIYAHSVDPERRQAYDGRNPDDMLE